MTSLEPLVGEWEVAFGGDVLGRAVFSWDLDGRYPVRRTSTPEPLPPDSLALIEPLEDGGYRQHYFGSRGVTRVYAMEFDGRVWTLERTEADFSPLSFKQRFVGELADGVIATRWSRTRATAGSPTSS